MWGQVESGEVRVGNLSVDTSNEKFNVNLLSLGEVQNAQNIYRNSFGRRRKGVGSQSNNFM
jgi:hypothetical protein